MKNYPFTDDQLKKLHADVKKLVDYAGTTPTIRAPNPRLEQQGLAWKKLKPWLRAQLKQAEIDEKSDDYDKRTEASHEGDAYKLVLEAMDKIELKLLRAARIRR